MEIKTAWLIIAVLFLGTFPLRAFPFATLKKLEDSRTLEYIGKFLPAATMLILVLYCLKHVDFSQTPHGLYEALALSVVILTQLWRRNGLLSIILGTSLYMVLVQG